MSLLAACKAFLDTAFPKRTERQRLEADLCIAVSDWWDAKARHAAIESKPGNVDTRELGRARMDMIRATRRQVMAELALKALGHEPTRTRALKLEVRGRA